MKQLSFFNKIIFLINILVALLLLMSFFGSYVSVKAVPFLSLLNLAIPLLVGANLVFLIYWILKLKKQFFLSFAILLLGYFILNPYYLLGSHTEDSSIDNISIMTYNTRNFNYNKNLPIQNADSLIVELIKTEKPDIVCFQEFYFGKISTNDFNQYPYKYVDFVFGDYSNKVIQSIYSKYPIVKKKNFDFPDSNNNAIYADILYKKDTIRIYNMHLQSFNVIPSVNAVMEEPSDKLYNRLTKSILKQEQQANMFLEHNGSNTYKTIVCGDFNNNQYSRVYKIIKGDANDSFDEKGSGFGRTYNFLGMPLRIDFILADQEFEIISHKNYDTKLSDHYPVMATFNLPSH